MLTIITCAQCGDNPCPNEIGDVSVTVVLGTLRSVCEKCYHRENGEHKIWLCSPKCLLDFIAAGRLEREVGIANGTIRPWAETNVDPVNTTITSAATATRPKKGSRRH